MLHKILKNRKIWAAALLMVLLALGIAQAAGVQPQKSSISGQVATVVSVGTQVSEGSVLVTVKTLTGTAPAARANCSGKVVSVEVAPGSQIAAEQVVATIQP